MELSIILISHNQSWNIPRLIESVLHETTFVQEREILLVDSASSDGTAELAATFPIRVLRLPASQRLTAAAGRYVGCKHTSGKLVLFHHNPEFDDAAVDRQGRLLVGTVNMQDPFLPEGSLYRLDPDGSFHRLDTGYATANGIGLSPDGRTVYVADQRHRKIMAMDYDTVSGTVSNQHLFALLEEEDGMPDGLIVDAEGFIWSGHWAGWKLTRYDPDGKIERQIRFPVEHVISCAFGGKDLDELFVTAASWGFTEDDWKAQPWAGDLFRVHTGVRGLVEPVFARKSILQVEATS